MAVLTRILARWADRRLERKVVRLEAKLTHLGADISTLNARLQRAQRQSEYWKQRANAYRAKTIVREIEHA